jgi:hypothetical protein
MIMIITIPVIYLQALVYILLDSLVLHRLSVY